MPVMTAELNASQNALLPQLSPTGILDRSLHVLRRGPLSRVGRGLAASVPLATVCLGLYYLEMIEGVRTLRPVFAVLIGASFVYRALVLSQLAAAFVLELRPGLPMPGRGGELARVASLATIVGFGTWLWLWPLSWLAQFSPFAMIGLVPLLALRGGVAPSWIARARCAPESGFRAWGLASDDTAGARASLVFAELLLLIGMCGLYANLFALTALLLVLSHSVLGLDVAFVSAFLSTDNTFVAYGLLAVVIFLFDPLRAAVSACVFADARGRKDGADLHAAVDALTEDSRPEPNEGLRPAPVRSAAGSGMLLLLAVAGMGASAPLSARAEDPAPSAETANDGEVQRAVERILARREFAEVGPAGTRTFENWLRDLIERWFSKDAEEPGNEDRLRVELPDVSPWLVMLVVFTLLLIAVIYVTWEARERDPPPMAPAGPLQPKPSERPAPLLLSDARALAAAGDYAAALRALYAATLAALDRGRYIQFDPAKTNGYYLRLLPAGGVREAFAAFTAIFDRKWYGREAVSQTDYERGLELAERICASESKKP